MKFLGRPDISFVLIHTAILLIVFAGVSPKAAAEDADQKPAMPKSFMVISTGIRNSDEYLLGSTICKMVNLRSKENNIYCSITSSSGPIMNVDRMRRGNADFIILKSSKILQAVKGSSAFANPRPFKDLRAVMTGYTQDLTFLTSKKSKIEKFVDFQGKIVNVDDDLDGAATLTELLNGENKDPFVIDKQNTDFSKQTTGLCTDTFSVVAVEVAHRNDELGRVVEQCGLNIVGLEQSMVKRLAAKNSYLSETVIAANTYPHQTVDVQTVGEGVSVVTTKSTDPKLVNSLVSSVVGQLTKFRNAMPFLRNANVLDLQPKTEFIQLYPGIESSFQQ